MIDSVVCDVGDDGGLTSAAVDLCYGGEARRLFGGEDGGEI